MKTAKLLALTLVALALAGITFAQTTAVAPAPPQVVAPTPGTSSPVSPSAPGQGDVLVKPPDAPVVGHGTAAEPAPVQTTVLTNDTSTDEVADVVAFDQTPLTDAVNALALQANLNIQFDPKLLSTVGPDGHPVPITPPNITAKWKNVTARQALVALLNNWGWQLVMDPSSPIARITVKDPTALEPLVTSVYDLQYSTPSNIVEEVKNTLSPRSTIITDSRTHKLIIRTTDRELPGVTALIAKLDSATRQVLIEARIVETQKDITSAKGINWTGTLAAQHVTFGNGNTTGTIASSSTTGPTPITTTTTTLPNGTTVPTTSGGNITTVSSNISSFLTTVPGVPFTGGSPGGGGISLNTARGFSPATAFLNADGVSAVLSFLNTDADTRSLSFPRTVALDGVQTELKVVQNIPIFEQQQSAPAAGASQGLATVLPNYDKKVEGTVLNEVGVKLTVLPRIAGPTNVMMDLRPEISSVDAQVASDTLDGQVSTSPIFDRRSIVTQAAVPSGYTLVLGGLESDNANKNFTKVPALGDIPVLGYLFRSDSKTRLKDTILIFVTPTIVRDTDFQPSDSEFLKRKPTGVSSAEERAWDTGKPYDWTKPNTGVTPSYQP
jgi:type II secretory pathway component GspD/PulD (secretin)